MHVIVTEEDHLRADLRTVDEMHPFLNQRLPIFICRVCLACDNELNGLLRMGEDPKQSLGIMKQQVGSLVRGKSTSKSKGKDIRIKEMFRLIHHLYGCT